MSCADTMHIAGGACSVSGAILGVATLKCEFDFSFLTCDFCSTCDEFVAEEKTYTGLSLKFTLSQATPMLDFLFKKSSQYIIQTNTCAKFYGIH